MQGVCARLEHYADRAAAVSAIFGGVIVLQKAKFLHRLGIGVEDNLIASYPVVEPAIEQVGYRVPSSSGDAYTAVTVIGIASILGTVRTYVRRRDGNNTRLSQRQIQRVAAIQWQILNRFAGDRASNRSAHGFDLCRVCLHLHR